MRDASARATGEPFLLARVETGLPGRLVRVSRPGRGACGSQGRVGPEVVGDWVDAVVGALGVGSDDPAPEVHYVCLLGRKEKGRSEIAGFYDARAPWETAAAPLFEDWLNGIAAGRARFVVHHFATIDGDPVSRSVLDEIGACLHDLLSAGRPVLLGCSAALRRSREVLDHLGWTGAGDR
ncbi:hypothetical protein KGQ64_05295 [bacterium]|nr:hypothetical protein [bacterium]